MTQRGRSLSSAEAEYYAIVTGAAEALAVQALAEEMGWKMSVRVHTDSSAAKAVASRRGLEKLRHIELKYLWVQELVEDQRIVIKKINGLDNPADCLTKAKKASSASNPCFVVQEQGGDQRLPKEVVAQGEVSDLKVDTLPPAVCYWVMRGGCLREPRTGRAPSPWR